MYRNIPLMIAFSAVVASPAVFAADTTNARPRTSVAQETQRADKPQLTRVSDRKHDAASIKTAHREPAREHVALASMDASTDGWRSRVTAAGPASEVTQNLVQMEAQSEEKLNVFGMLAAALGLGVMSIVRRMGRF